MHHHKQLSCITTNTAVMHHHNHSCHASPQTQLSCITTNTLVSLRAAHTHDIHRMPGALLSLTSWSCRPYAEKYAESQDAFFEDYTKAHLKLSELGVKWDPEPIEFDT